MSIAKLTARKYPYSEMEPIVSALLKHLVVACDPEEVYLIGSAARGEFTDFSDLDFVIVAKDDAAVRVARGIVHIGRPHLNVAVDFIVLDCAGFAARADLGGIAFEAKHHGKNLYRKGST